MTATENATEIVTTEPYGASGTSEFVYLNGREIGSITDTLAAPKGARGCYHFATRDDALAACVSYAQRGYWTREI